MMKRNRRKDVFLDFTSLLDITLILLFFFIMYTSLELNSAKNEAMHIKEDLESKQEIVNEKVSLLESSDEVSNSQALLQYIEGNHLKLVLKDNDELHVVYDNKTLKKLSLDEDLYSNIKEVLEDQKIEESDTVLAQFIYNGNQKGSRNHCKIVRKAISKVKKKYKHLYLSEIETSIVEE